MKFFFGLFAAALLVATAHADVWDGNDELIAKPHDLTHGAEEAHDLGARPGPLADVDWLRVPQDAYCSYEVSIDGVAAQLDPLDFARFDSTGSGLLQTGAAPNVVGGTSRVLEWKNGATAAFGWVRVQGAACGTSCGKDAAYRIRAAETTVAVSRFDNTTTWQTTLLINNLRSTSRSVSVYYWSALSGSLISASTSTFSIPAHGTAKLPTFISASGQVGAITIAHDAGYGGLAVKATTTDTATNVSFDTFGTYKPR